MGLINAAVLAIRAAMAKASGGGTSSGLPTADIIDSIAYGNHTQNVAKNTIQPVCIDLF